MDLRVPAGQRDRHMPTKLDLVNQRTQRDKADIQTFHVPHEGAIDIRRHDPIAAFRISSAKRPEIPGIEAVGGPLALDGIGSPTAPS